MEKIVESCKLFSKLIKCDLNTTAQECERTKTSLAKYCSNKECEGNYRVFLFKITMIILTKAHALIGYLLKIDNNILFKNNTHVIVVYERELKSMTRVQISVKFRNIIRRVAYH